MKTKLAVLALITCLITACASSTGGSGPTASGIKAYPLKVCLVTDNDLDSMGDQQIHSYQGKQLKFCCPPCWEKFQTNPAKYLAKLPQ
jgi:YHS domain-containing protein